MNLRVLTGGQTGVDRGAWLGARDHGIARGGWMPHDERDETGDLIPDEIRADLKRCPKKGYPARTAMNVEDSTAVVIVVPSIYEGIPPDCVGSKLTHRLARKLIRPCFIADDKLSVRRGLVDFVRHVVRFKGEDFSLMVAGPRASKWTDGERVAREVVAMIVSELRQEGVIAA